MSSRISPRTGEINNIANTIATIFQVCSVDDF